MNQKTLTILFVATLVVGGVAALKLSRDDASVRSEAPGAELLQAAHLRVHVIRFDIQVHPARMRDRLHLDMQPIFRVNQPHVFVAFFPGQDAQAHAQCAAPEFGRGLQLRRVAVDDEAGQPALVHDKSPVSLDVSRHKQA